MNLFGRRRHFLIDRLQYKLLAINIFYLTTIVFLFLVAIFVPVIIALYSDSSFERSAAAATDFLSLHKRVWPAVPVALLLISVHSILVSHRIAGPLYRFRRVFRSIEKGDLSVRSGVRKKDYLLRESNTINDMIEGLVGQVGRIKQQQREVQAVRAELGSFAGVESLPGLAQLLDRLDSRLAALDEEMAGFRLPEGETGEGVDAEGAGDVVAVAALVDSCGTTSPLGDQRPGE
jgi:methyl-accepting chemotaxis protein